MKKLLALVLCFVMVFCFAACGGSSEGADSKNANTGKEPTSISFNTETITIGVDEYYSLSKNITFEPADAKITYTVSDENICEASKKGEEELTDIIEIIMKSTGLSRESAKLFHRRS